VSISLHPGNIQTDLARSAGSMTQILGRLITYPISYGAITPLYAGTAPAAGELNGKVGNI
jgi:retinol dehydrogenase 12